jgi:uncharacterized protein (DUF2132 family)
MAVGDGQRLETREALTGLVRFVDGLKGCSLKERLDRLREKYGWSGRYERKE